MTNSSSFDRVVLETRSEFILRITINGKKFNRVIIDQHYKVKHADTVNDQLILELIKKLDGETVPVDEEKGEFKYLIADPLIIDSKPYRIILLICNSDDYLGVINVFRVNRRS